MKSVLSIEVGYCCNNRCTFCYQRGWRERGGQAEDPGTSDLLERLRSGRENGFSDVAFSGGEPTIRKDFLKLIAEAKSLGYRKISITTNGRMFSHAPFVNKALAEGLTGIGWSVHGSDEATHDGLVGHEGAFRQVVRGMHNVARVAAEQGLKIEQNIFVLVNARNFEQVEAIGRLGRTFGIRLLVVQPVTFSRGNLAHAAGLRVPLDVLVESVRRAAIAGRTEGYFIKLFNLPLCLFTDVLDVLELQRYPISVFRVQDRGLDDSGHRPGVGFMRLDRCGSCALLPVCPGLSTSLVPSSCLRRLALDEAEFGGSNHARVAGLELLDASDVEGFLRDVWRRSQARYRTVYHGGDSVAGEAFAAAAFRSGATGLQLYFRGGYEGGSDVSRHGSGNRDRLLVSLEWGTKAGFVRTGVVSEYMGREPVANLEAVRFLAEAGAANVELAFPVGFKVPDLHDALAWGGMAVSWHRQTGGELVFAFPDSSSVRFSAGPWRLGLPLPWARLEDVGPTLVKHPMCTSEFGWIELSVPPFFPGIRTSDRSVHLVSGIQGEPVIGSMLDRMRAG